MKDDRVYLGHIRDAIQDIQQYAAVGHDAFMADRMRQDAVIRKFEIIGEAVKHLSDRPKELRPAIPWRRIAGMRDRLTHDYFGVDLSLVWVAVERDLPALKTAVEPAPPHRPQSHRAVGQLSDSSNPLAHSAH